MNLKAIGLQMMVLIFVSSCSSYKNSPVREPSSVDLHEIKIVNYQISEKHPVVSVSSEDVDILINSPFLGREIEKNIVVARSRSITANPDRVDSAYVVCSWPIMPSNVMRTIKKNRATPIELTNIKYTYDNSLPQVTIDTSLEVAPHIICKTSEIKCNITHLSEQECVEQNADNVFTLEFINGLFKKWSFTVDWRLEALGPVEI